MGGSAFALTNPGLQYDPTQSTDPVTGLPVVTPPIVKYFKNPMARAHQAALDEMSTVQPGTSDLSSLRIADDGSTTGTPTDDAPPATKMPKFVQPSFSQTTRDANGLPLPINPAETKLGKLVHILAAAGQGALAGWGTGNAAAGADRARNIPFEQAQQRQELAKEQAQTALTQSQSAMVQTPYGPMPAGMAKLLFPALVKAGATVSAAQIGGQARIGSAQIGADSREDVAGINKRFIPVDGVGLFDTQSRSLVPDTGKGIMITPEIAADHNLPAAFIGKPMSLQTLISMSPKASTTSSSSTTDLMGNTKTTNQRTTAPVISPSNPAGGTVAPVSTAQPTGAGPAPVPAPRRPVAAPAGGGTPAPTSAATPRTAASTSQPAAVSPVFQLAPDVEQRLASSGLSSTDQKYVRGLLAYQGQMPSPRNKNYALTLATLTSIDPGFNAANYDANKKTLEDYTPGGSVGKQAIAFNTAISHLNLLDQAADAMKNGNVVALNQIANSFSVQTGKSAVTTFKNIADAVNGEVSKTFKGNATEGELGRVGANFDSSLGPDQIKNNVRSTIGLLNGKMGEMQSAFQRQIGKPINLVSPEAQSAILRMNAPSHEVFGPDGSTLIGHVVNNKFVPLQ